MDIYTQLVEYFPHLEGHEKFPTDDVQNLKLTRPEMFKFAHYLFGKYEVNLSAVPSSPPDSMVRIKDVVAWIEFSLL